MTAIENRALDALLKTSMRSGSSGKRFRRDIEWQREHTPDFKMTARQARYLWLLIDLYRRQIGEVDLRRFGAEVKLTDELPAIYQPGDHAEPKGEPPAKLATLLARGYKMSQVRKEAIERQQKLRDAVNHPVFGDALCIALKHEFRFAVLRS